VRALPRCKATRRELSFQQQIRALNTCVAAIVGDVDHAFDESVGVSALHEEVGGNDVQPLPASTPIRTSLRCRPQRTLAPELVIVAGHAHRDGRR